MERNPNLTKLARQLRKNQTKEEALLWYNFLSKCPVRFHRQYVIGNYIADFYCHNAKLVIELDGSQHFEEENKAADAQRDTYLKEQGIEVLRIPNNAVKDNFAGVCAEISGKLEGVQKEMKKLICILSVLALLAAMAGCGAGETAATDPTEATAPTQPVTEPQEEKIKLYLPVSSTDGESTMTWEYEVVEPTNSSSIMCREYMAIGNDVPVSVARRNASPYKLRVEQLTEDNQVSRFHITEYDEAGHAIRFTDRTPLADGDYSDVITEYTYNEAGIPTGEVCYEQQQEKGVLSEKVKISETAYTVEQTNEGWTVTNEEEALVKFYNDKGWLVKQTQEVFGKVTTTTYTHNEVGAVTEYTLQAGDEEPVVTVFEYAGVPVTEDVAKQFPMFCRG